MKIESDRSTPTCHPWTSVSEIPAFAGMTEQVGRSMVEMLGVLAVMGVLSVAGIAGYNNAMNKYRANELLNESNKRATIVAMQIAAGRGEEQLSISEFNNTIFSESISYTPATKRFSFTLSGVDSAICQQMKNMVGDKTQIRKINPDCTLITYNADLSTNDMIDVGECDNGNIYLSYAANPCAQNNANGNFECKKNSDCEVGEFCKIVHKAGKMMMPGSSTCESIGTGTSLPKEDITLAGKTIKKDTFLKAPWVLSFWSAKNWCQAQGKQLVTFDDFNLWTPQPADKYKCQMNNLNCLDKNGESLGTDYWTVFQSKIGKNTFWIDNWIDTGYTHYIDVGDAISWNTAHAPYTVLCK